MNKIKRRVSMVMVCIMLIAQSYCIYASANYEGNTQNDFLAVQVKEKQYNNGSTTVLGKELISEELDDISDGILLFMYLQKITDYDNFSYSNTAYSGDEYIYSKNNIAFYCNKVNVKNIIIAENDINIYSTKLLSEENTIIYSKNGNINIGVDRMDFNGIIYAPNGNVTINASEANMTGTLICNKLVTNTGYLRCEGNEKCQVLYNLFREIKNDTILNAKIKVNDDGVFKTNYECNKELEKADIYIRIDNGDKYEFYMELPENGEFTVDKEYLYLDVALYGYTSLGETVKSNVESYDIYNNEIQYYYCDTDKDGLSDGEEVWLTNTNPKNSDTDLDGFSDYYECMMLGTDPTIYTVDEDYDHDGLMNSVEKELGTNPLLYDSDFDGVSDGADGKQYFYNGTGEVSYENYKISIGCFDKVMTSINEEFKLTRTVYNPITRVVKQYGYGDVISSIFYDGSGRKNAEIVKNNNDYRVNIYSYDENNNIVQIINNSDIYEYEYYEDGSIQNVSINGNKVVAFDTALEQMTYANSDTYSVLTDEDKNTYNLVLNDMPVMKCIEGQNGEIVHFSNTISNIEYTYEYLETGFIKNVYSNKEFSSNYTYNEDSTIIDYNDGRTAYQQINYTEKENEVDISLISGKILNKFEKDNVISYSVSGGEKIIQNTTYTYKDDKVYGISYADGLRYEYEYNLKSQISKILENGNVVKEYEYYENGQLFKEKDIINNLTCVYYYDSYNNILKTETYYKDELSCENHYAYDSNLWKDVLSDFNGKRITYDEIGNPIEYYDGSTFKWNGRELSEVNISDKSVKYAYDNNGIRNYKNVNGEETFYFVEGKDIIAEKTGEDIIWYIYDNQNEIFGFVYNEEAYYYDKNATKDVIRILDYEGNEVCKYNYDAWGSVINIEGDTHIASLNPIRYRSYYYDKDTKLYYLETRFYDANTKRFINADNVLRVNCQDMDLNLYAYCGCDPINLYDPTGQALTSIGLFSITQFEQESDDLKYAICRTFDRTTTWLYRVGDTKVSFEKWWDSLGKTDLVIINCHAIPAKLSVNGYTYLVSEPGVNNLKKADIKLLVLLGCNAGHFSVAKNMANAFANIITGKVVASDGTVYTNKYKNTYFNLFTIVNGYVSYRSDYDEEFKKYCGENSRTNYGWLVYVGRNNDTSRIYFLGNGAIKKLTVEIMCELIDNSKLYNSYK